MSLGVVLLSVLIPLGVGAFFAYAIWRWHQGRQLKSYLPTKHTNVYKFDLRTRKVLASNIVDLQRSPFKDLDRHNWDSINIIIDKFDDRAQRYFRIAFDKLEKGSEFEKIVFDHPSLNFKKHMTRFVFTFYKSEEAMRYFMKLEWDAKPIEKKKKILEKRHFSKEEIAADPSPAKGLVAFNVISGNEENLLEIVSKLYITKRELTYFISNGYLIFFFGGKSMKDAKRKVEKFITLFVKAGYESGANQMFEGSAYAVSMKFHTVKTVNNAVHVLNFPINVSIETKQNFIDWEIVREKSRQQEYDSFDEATRSFRQSVKTRDVDSKIMNVRKWVSKRKTVDYLYPHIEGINNKLMSRILRNKNNIESLIDAHADKMILGKMINQPCLIDITQDWIIKNKDAIYDNKIVYVVRIDPYRDLIPLQEVLMQLAQKGLVFAFRVADYNDAVTTLIKNVSPNFLVVSKRVWNAEGLLDSEMLFRLMTLKKLADQFKIKMIYQEPPTGFVDETTADKIGLQFYFDITE